MKSKFTIRKIGPEDTDWIKQIFIQYWGGDFIVSRGKIYKTEEFTEGYVAEQGNNKTGFITYKIFGHELEITGLVSQNKNKGTGTKLVNSVLNTTKREGIKRVCLVTTNDNLNALGFWQKRGFTIVKVYPNAMEATRRLKPSLPLIGENNIPLRDEIELEMILSK